MHVAVLKGGISAEREVSLTSGAAVEKALLALGHAVTAIDVSARVVEDLLRAKPDVVFNALHGRYGEDGCIQGLLEMLKIPYTHSGVLASAVAMDKPMARIIFAAAGLRVAQGVVAHKDTVIGGDVLPRPYVVKPANEGSSVGVKLVFANDNFHFTHDNWPYGETVLVEQYIPGRELTVAVLDGVAQRQVGVCTRKIGEHAAGPGLPGLAEQAGERRALGIGRVAAGVLLGHRARRRRQAGRARGPRRRAGDEQRGEAEQGGERARHDPPDSVARGRRAHRPRARPRQSVTSRIEIRFLS